MIVLLAATTPPREPRYVQHVLLVIIVQQELLFALNVAREPHLKQVLRYVKHVNPGVTQPLMLLYVTYVNQEVPRVRVELQAVIFVLQEAIQPIMVL